MMHLEQGQYDRLGNSIYLHRQRPCRCTRSVPVIFGLSFLGESVRSHTLCCTAKLELKGAADVYLFRLLFICECVRFNILC